MKKESESAFFNLPNKYLSQLTSNAPSCCYLQLEKNRKKLLIILNKISVLALLQIFDDLFQFLIGMRLIGSIIKEMFIVTQSSAFCASICSTRKSSFSYGFGFSS